MDQVDSPASKSLKGLREIPQDRVYFRIGEVATLLGVDPHVVRFWQQQFPAVRPERSQAGRFLYPRAAVERLVRIRQLLYDEGYTIAGAKKALQSRATARNMAPQPAAQIAPTPTATPPVATGPSRRETELDAEVERLQRDLRAVQARLEAAQQGESYARQREAGAVQHEEVAAARQRASLQAALGEVTALLARLD